VQDTNLCGLDYMYQTCCGCSVNCNGRHNNMHLTDILSYHDFFMPTREVEME
jgi:hypothetical protein